MEPWSVLKFGGTSVAQPAHWPVIAGLVEGHRAAGERVLLVCSALAGVTDALEDLATNPEEPAARLEALLHRHARFAAELGIDAAELLVAAERELGSALAAFARTRDDAGRALLLAQGELMSSRLGAQYLAERTEAGWVDSRTALESIPEDRPDARRGWLSARCHARPDPELQARWRRLAPVLVTPGFVARNAAGDTVLLGRGGSDTSAALLAAALEARSLEIWTDVLGLYSADPREIRAAERIRKMDFLEALEMAAGGARVVHPRAIRAAADANIPMHVRDLSQPERTGTWIGHEVGWPGIKAITRQDGMLVLLLENRDTRQQVGFLAAVFREIAEAGVSVDQVATSETTTTVAINARANHLGRADEEVLIQALRRHCRVTAFHDCCCVNLVGRDARRALRFMGTAANWFRERRLLMLSASANDLSISMLVERDDVNSLIAGMHRKLIEERNPMVGGTGP